MAWCCSTGSASSASRTPLRAGEAVDDLVVALEQQVCRLAAFACEFVELTRIESGQLQFNVAEADAMEIVRGVLADCSKRAVSAGVTLRSAGEALRVRTDPARLAQVLTNLVGNAVRYNHPGGTVEVRVEAAYERVLLRVVDDGLGIPATDLPLVFQRFYRVRRPGTEVSVLLPLAPGSVAVSR